MKQRWLNKGQLVLQEMDVRPTFYVFTMSVLSSTFLLVLIELKLS